MKQERMGHTNGGRMAALVSIMHRLRRIASAKMRILMKRRNVIRWAPTMAAIVILAHAALPSINAFLEHSLYQLSPEALRVVGGANKNLSAKFSYDSKGKSWLFNKEGKSLRAAQIAEQQGSNPEEVAPALAQMQAQVGGGGEKDNSLYSVELPSDAKDGVTFHDNQTSQSFSMVPKFGTGAGKKWQDRIIYPFGGDGQIVYTAKTNGIKEDIVLNKFIDEELSYAYDLKLSDALDARLMADGSIGVFSADPALYSNITYGNDVDRKKIEDARKNAEKDHLSFAIPAPVVIDAEGKKSNARYTLVDDTLTVTANKLDELKYPISIDPSVAITSSNDFERGNDEGMIEYGNDRITRSDVSGGTLSGTWSTATSLSSVRKSHTSVAYNGFLYVIGGANASGGMDDVSYAPINSNGSIGSWSSTTSLNGNRYFNTAFVYNNYLYVIGGYGGGITRQDVQFAPVNADGTLGAWSTTSNLSTARQLHSSVVYGNYVYALGGYDGTGYVNSVEYAEINADGTLGSWNTTTSFTTARQGHTSVAYNGVMYVIGGYTGSYQNSVQYAKINSNGTLGSWATTTSFTSARYQHTSVVSGGYVYVLGGHSSGTEYSDVQYALINADGTLGPWRTTQSFATDRQLHTTVEYNGYLYVIGGTAQVTNIDKDDVQYHKIDPAGSVSNVEASTTAGASLNGSYSFTHNGYIYHAGGTTGTVQTTVRYAPINANGSYGTWSTTSALTSAVSFGGVGVYNGRVYLFGGFNSAVVQYATFNNNGTLSAWTAGTSLPSACGNHSGAVYKGFIYYVCGSGNGSSSRVRIAPINDDGTVGSWTLSPEIMNQALANEAAYAYAGYLYIVGGSSSGTYYDLVQYAPINADGTLGSFALASDMNQEVGYSNVGVINGYMYRVGGENSGGGLTTIEYAPINNNGSLGEWKYTTSLTVTGSRSGFSQSGDRFYTIGGLQNGTRSSASYSITVQSGGSGNPTGWSSAGSGFASAYTNGVSAGETFVHKGYVYYVGGYNNTDLRLATVRSAPIADDGTIGSWTTVSSLPAARNDFTLSVYNGYVYVYAGTVSAGPTNTYTYAQLGDDGALGSWSTQDDMGSVPARTQASGVAYGGYLYIAGGVNGSTRYSDVHYAPLAANGSVGAWTSSSSFSTARDSLTVEAYGGYMYVIGGKTETNTGYLADVQYASLNSNGSLGTWNKTASLAQYRASHASTVYNGRIYVVAGTNPLGGLRTTESATITPNGSLGNWETAGPSLFTTQRVGSSAQIHQGRLYIIGGYGAGSYLNDAQVAPLQTGPRIARYSILVDLGASRTVDSVNYSGSFSPATTVRYREATSDGVFGTSKSGSAGPGSEPSASCEENIHRYVWLAVVMDDTLTATYGGDASTSRITSLDIFYKSSLRPEPSKRLLGGKSFQQETLKQLDTC